MNLFAIAQQFVSGVDSHNPCLESCVHQAVAMKSCDASSSCVNNMFHDEACRSWMSLLRFDVL